MKPIRLMITGILYVEVKWHQVLYVLPLNIWCDMFSVETCQLSPEVLLDRYDKLNSLVCLVHSIGLPGDTLN